MTKSEGRAALIHVVRRNLQLVAVGIAEINRVRDLVILEFEFDSALFQLPLRGVEIFAIRTKRQMKHSNFAVCGRFRLIIGREQREPGVSCANESWDTIPHAFVKSLETENVDVPFGRSFNVADAHGHMINAFELHEKTSKTPSTAIRFVFLTEPLDSKPHMRERSARVLRRLPRKEIQTLPQRRSIPKNRGARKRSGAARCESVSPTRVSAV